MNLKFNLLVVVIMGNVVPMVMAVGGFVIAMDVVMGMDMGVLVGVGHTVVAVLVGVLMGVFVVVLQGNGVFDHQHRRDDHNR